MESEILNLGVWGISALNFINCAEAFNPKTIIDKNIYSRFIIKVFNRYKLITAPKFSQKPFQRKKQKEDDKIPFPVDHFMNVLFFMRLDFDILILI
jgi:hypothetical protein